MKWIILFCLLLTLSLSSQDDQVLELGRTTYQTCVACHGPDGRGVIAGDLQMAPSLHESEFVRGNRPQFLSYIILKGIVKADNRYVQTMLPLEATLNDKQIAALITYITKEFGGESRPVSAARVANWRKIQVGRKVPWKHSDLDEFLADGSAPSLLSHLRYQLYIGKWEKLPDFSSLSPLSSGTLEKNLLSLSPAKDQRRGFGIVFEADLDIPETGVYTFHLTSGDGSALIIDGETVIGNDGIHGPQTASAKETLEAGTHSLRALYFYNSGSRALTLSVKGPGDLGTRWLSESRNIAQKAPQVLEPILLTARNPGEAIVHRAFLPDAKPRAIAVGYPGAVNLVWDADVLNLAYLYQGKFINAATHWNGRGGDSTPLGKTRLKIAHGLPFQILETLDEPWQAFSEQRIRYERDTADPKEEIVIDIRHPDYQFQGYRLDQKRFPTFRYRYRELSVTDTFTPVVDEGFTEIHRTLTITGTPDAHTYFRLAETGPQTNEDGWIDVGHDLLLHVEGAEPITRTLEGQKETLLPIENATTLKLTYRWSSPSRP